MKRGSRTLTLALVAIGSLSACVDLFHSTDFETLCALDASAPGCAAVEGGAVDARPDAADAAPIDFCKLKDPKAMAEHACAWLGACSVPFDQNAFGQCMVNAILAFDCKANPNQGIAPGPLHDLWQSLGAARSCDDVNHALNPTGVLCSGTGFACAANGSPALLECVDGRGGAESCLMEGRVCAGAGTCAPKGAISSCSKSTCTGTVLHDCEGTSDLGYDCADFGAGTCVKTSAGASCQPSGATGSCKEAVDVKCSGATAESCPTGQSVKMDCARLGASCKPGTPSPVWNIAGQCQGSGACSSRCADTDTLEGCAQGVSFTTKCSKQGLKSCRDVKLPAGSTGYACGAP